MRKPRALVPGDRIAIVAPASPFDIDELKAGIRELQSLGYEPTYEDTVFAREWYVAGDASTRANALRRAWDDPSIAAIVAARGGYGSVQLLPLLSVSDFANHTKAFVGYSDNTSLMSWLSLTCGIVTFHGPMIEGRFARGSAGYDVDTFQRCLAISQPPGRITHSRLETVRPGEASGPLFGGTMTQLAASLGTPYAFDPPEGCVLFFDEVAERPYRVDRLFTQLVLAGVVSRASALVFGELPRCDEPGGTPRIRDVVVRMTESFNGPILFGLPSGHASGASLTLPFGVRARVIGAAEPALIIEEAAVV